jgi:hypothetical protein
MFKGPTPGPAAEGSGRPARAGRAQPPAPSHTAPRRAVRSRRCRSARRPRPAAGRPSRLPCGQAAGVRSRGGGNGRRRWRLPTPDPPSLEPVTSLSAPPLDPSALWLAHRWRASARAARRAAAGRRRRRPCPALGRAAAGLHTRGAGRRRAAHFLRARFSLRPARRAGRLAPALERRKPVSPVARLLHPRRSPGVPGHLAAAAAALARRRRPERLLLPPMSARAPAPRKPLVRPAAPHAGGAVAGAGPGSAVPHRGRPTV